MIWRPPWDSCISPASFSFAKQSHTIFVSLIYYYPFFVFSIAIESSSSFSGVDFCLEKSRKFINGLCWENQQPTLLHQNLSSIFEEYITDGFCFLKRLLSPFTSLLSFIAKRIYQSHECNGSVQRTGEGERKYEVSYSIKQVAKANDNHYGLFLRACCFHLLHYWVSLQSAFTKVMSVNGSV